MAVEMSIGSLIQRSVLRIKIWDQENIRGQVKI